MKIMRYLKPYWYWALLCPLCMVGEVFIDLQLPTLMSRIVDEGVLGHNMDLILRTGITMLLLTIFGGICGISSAAFGGISSHSFARDLRNDAFGKIMDLSYEQTDKFTTGSLVTRMTSDVTMVQGFIDQMLRMSVRAIIFFIGGIIMMLRLNVKFGIILLIALPLELIVVSLVVKKASPIFAIVQKKLDKVNSVVQENVSGARVVKAYVREKFETERFSVANDDLTSTTLRIARLMAIMGPVVMIILNLTTVSVILIGGTTVMNKAADMQIGSIMAAVMYSTQVMFSVMMVSMMFQSISRAKASIDRLNEVLDTEPVIVGGDVKCEDINEIEFKNVDFHYPGFSGRPVLKDISLKIRAGENVAILGSTGAGKSSFINLIPRFYDVTDGELLINGRNVKDYELESLRENISVVSQKTELFSGTIASNLKWGNEDATAEQLEEAAKIAQAEEFIQLMPDKYDGYVAEKGASLSGGQKQRMSIARSVIKKPKVLILDDSTSALDLSTEAKLRKLLFENLKGTTVITIAQRIAGVKDCDRIFVLDDGEIVAEGNHEYLLENSEVYRDIYDSQVRKGDELNVGE